MDASYMEAEEAKDKDYQWMKNEEAVDLASAEANLGMKPSRVLKKILKQLI